MRGNYIIEKLRETDTRAFASSSSVVCVFFSIHRMLIVYVLHLISHFLDSNHFGEIFSLNKSTNDKNYKITVHGTNEYIMLSYTNGERLWTERII